MKCIFWMLCLLLSRFALSEEKSYDFRTALTLFSEARYLSTLTELSALEKDIPYPEDFKKAGIISYWKGLCYNRLKEFDQAVISFEIALTHQYVPIDLHYEFGQALFALNKFPQARIQFRESLRKKFKKGVSLYYVGYISKLMGEEKKARTLFRMIKKLDHSEAKEVEQAAEFQIGDIYLEHAKNNNDALSLIENQVIPQYKKAYELDRESELAPLIQEKILMLQKKYDLLLFKLRNGRPILMPAYYLRLSQEVGQDTNVTFSPAGTTISKANQGSTYSRTDFLGKYAFYVKDFLSISPEVRFNYTYYLNRTPEIYRNDNSLLSSAVRTSFEHSFLKRPASFLLDYDFGESRRDVNADKTLDFSSTIHTLMLGERFHYFDGGESTLRLRYRALESYLNASNSIMTSLIFEQIKNLKSNTLLFYFGLDRMRVDNEIYDTNSITMRTDLIMARVRDWFTPSFGLALTMIDPINNRTQRGGEMLINPSARMAKTFKKNWRANLKFDYQKYNSKDQESFAYMKSIYAFELEYLF
jgi:tetratricopeptide (TPR) repeat protein